jgi:hypothetical protein
MSTLKSSAEDLTLNADGSGNDIKFQSNGSTVVTVDGSATSVGINETAPLGFLHVKNGDSGQGSINAAGNSLILESNGGAGITMLTGSSSNGSIIWGDSESNYQGVVLYDHSVNALKFITSNSERARISSYGLTFNGDTVEANALDDYEEGTWTGVISDGTNDATMSKTTGTYTKIGNMVTVTGFFKSSSLGSVTGSIRLNGLPFSTANNDRNAFGMAIGSTYGLAITAGETVGMRILANRNYADISISNSTGGTNIMDGSEWSDDGEAIISGSYMVS